MRSSERDAPGLFHLAAKADEVLLKLLTHRLPTGGTTAAGTARRAAALGMAATGPAAAGSALRQRQVAQGDHRFVLPREGADQRSFVAVGPAQVVERDLVTVERY